MKNGILSRSFCFVLILQFLNVQVQSAFATEAVTGNSPIVAAAVSRVMKKLEVGIQNRVSHMSESAQLRLAYRLYQRTVRLRNRTYRKSDEEIQNRISNVANRRQNPEVDVALTKELTADQALFQELEALNAIPMKLKRSQANRESLLAGTDPVLYRLGSVETETGELSRVSFASFVDHALEMNDALEGRYPASLPIIVKIILSLLILVAGLAILYVALAVLAIGSVFGGLTTGGIILFWVVVVGTITGVVFGIRGILRSELDQEVKQRAGRTPILLTA